MKLIIDPEAEAELRDAALWYENEQSGLGTDFRNAVDEALHQIARNPSSGSVMEGFELGTGIRRVVTRRFPFVIIYDDLSVLNSVYVLAVAHQRREPNYWFSRKDNLHSD